MVDVLVRTAIVSLQPLQFGLHMAILNAPMAYMGCDASRDCIPGWSPVLPGSIYAVGGLVGSVLAAPLMQRLGVVGCLRACAAVFVAGAVALALAHTQAAVVAARVVTGVASGACVVASPVYISVHSPSHLKGLLGTSTQLNVNAGIILAQLLGVIYAGERWRLIMRGAAGVSVIAAAALLTVPRDAPPAVEAAEDGAGARALSRDPRYRRPLLLAVAIFAVQQLTGVNAIIVYGVQVLANVLPDQARVVNLLVSIVNLFTTAASAALVDRVGSRRLLLASLRAMGLFTAALAFGLTTGRQWLTVSAVFLTTVSFALGIGPIPFLYVGEVTPPEALGAAQSVGTVSSWLSTFAVLSAFPLVDQRIGHASFYIFSACSLVSAVVLGRVLPHRPLEPGPAV